MKRIVRYLRRQPEDTRIKILYILTVACAFFLFILWVNSFGIDSKDREETGSFKKGLAPFSILKENIVESSKNIKTPW